MKLKPFAFAAALLLAGSAFAAADKPGQARQHAHEHKPVHGGVVVEARDIDYELVAKAGEIQLYLRDHGTPSDLSKASAKLTLLTGKDKQEVELKPAGDRLEAKGSFKLGAGSKAVAVVMLAGKPAATVRFALR